VKNMEVKLALALPDGLAMTRIEVSDKVLTITAISTQLSPCCPSVAHQLRECIVATPAKSQTCHAEASACVCWCRCANTFAM
jgi:hypothetical protein